MLHEELRDGYYDHAFYSEFYVYDPKLRKINKACVRDRVLHHAVFRKLYPIFDPTFIFDSYSCRISKGTHAAVRRLHHFFKKASRNNIKTCWALKCDVKKFFDSIDQDILMGLIGKKVNGKEVMWLISKIIKSFSKGLPLGNITSQLFANIYLNELDQHVKHVLRVKYYLRYCDDFIILHHDRQYLEGLVPRISLFLKGRLALNLHPNKVIFRKYRQGVDFLGYVSFPSHTILRPRTEKRMFRKITQRIMAYQDGQITKESLWQTLQSYLGMLSHCNAHKIRNTLVRILRHHGIVFR